MNTQEQMLKDDIMRRVRFVYGMKRLPAVFMPKIAVLTSLVAVASFFVSMPNVLGNMPSIFELPRFFWFMISAFINTTPAIQIISVGVLAVVVYMVRDIVKTFRVPKRVFATA